MGSTVEVRNVDQIQAIVNGALKKWLGEIHSAKVVRRSDTIGGPEYIVITVGSVQKAKVDQLEWELQSQKLTVTKIKNGQELKVE